jgi:hypothetical protein
LTELAGSAGLIEGMPYQWIGLDVRFSNRSCPPVVRRVNKRWGDLSVTIEVEMATIDRQPRHVVCRVIEVAVLQGLIAVAAQYDRATDPLEARLREVREEASSQKS